jgi:hypothetical protein
MKTYQVSLAAWCRAYATVTIEAYTEDHARIRAREILVAQGRSAIDRSGDVELEADYDTLDDFELLDDLVEIEKEVK